MNPSSKLLFIFLSLSIYMTILPQLQNQPLMPLQNKVIKQKFTLPPATPETIKLKNTEILNLKKQLSAKFENNRQLQNLAKEKKDIKNKIQDLISMIEKEHESNTAKLESFSKAKNLGKVPPLMQKTIDALQKSTQEKQTLLGKYHKKLLDTKQAIKKTDPERAKLVKKYQEEVKKLQMMQLSLQNSKTIDRIK